jgi:hypothetical protein
LRNGGQGLLGGVCHSPSGSLFDARTTVNLVLRRKSRIPGNLLR